MANIGDGTLTIEQATKHTGIGRTTLWKAVKNGKLRCFKIGKRVLFSKEQLTDFLMQYEKNSPKKVA